MEGLHSLLEWGKGWGGSYITIWRGFEGVVGHVQCVVCVVHV